MLFESRVGTHTIPFDVPAGLGGKDRAPTPTEYFVASLGACIGVYVADYCERAAIAATGMRVEISYEKAQNPSRMANFKARIIFPNGNGIDAKRERAILRVAEHCLIHQTLVTFDAIMLEIAAAAVPA
jgi:uncharacterized OsmC-like protein